MDLTITLSARQDEDLVEVTGAVDHASVPYLRQVLFDLFDAGRCQVTVEVSQLRILDASSIRALLFLHDRARQLGGDLRVAGATGTVLAALEITGAVKKFHGYDELHWPPDQRERRVVDVDRLRISHGQWPPAAGELLHRLHVLREDEPERRRVRDRVIELCLPAAHRLARRYAGHGETLDELAQVAALALVKAVDGFDPTRGVDFGAYATPTILGDLRRYFRDRSSGIRMPRRLQELRLAADQVRDDLTQRLGRSPTTADLAAHLDVDEEQVIEMIGATYGHRPLSLDGAGSAGDEQDTTLQDIVGADDPAFGLVEHRQSLRVLLARLPERQQRILSFRFYGNLTQAEIAQEVGMSQMHVSRLLRQSLEFLHRRLTE